jgi:hypothetical protein
MRNSLLIVCTLTLAAFLLTGTLYAQNITSIKFPTAADSNSSFCIKDSSSTNLLRLNADGGFYLGGEYSTGVIPKEGTGTRLMWFPRKAAFRAGYIDGTQWNDANIGYFSVAIGHNATASGISSVAMGPVTNASGGSSVALGNITTASGSSSTALGGSTTASGSGSTAMGGATIASGTTSTAMGIGTNASGDYSTAMGNHTIASGNTSIVTGYYSIANGDYSTAMGSLVKVNHRGSFMIGDFSKMFITSYDSSSAENEMTMRFSGGYRLFSNSACSTGVYMNSGESGWTSVCDRNKKENFHQIDGEQILTKIREMPITEWNYKGTDPTVKYIGPVAQDFYAAFHLGGTDSLGINTLCIDGVNIAAIQALEKRTTELKTALNELQKANEKIAQVEKNNSEMQIRLEKLEHLIASTPSNNAQGSTSSK